MTNIKLTRRGFLARAGAGPVIAQDTLPMVDYHAHIDAMPTLEGLFEVSGHDSARLDHYGSVFRSQRPISDDPPRQSAPY